MNFTTATTASATSLEATSGQYRKRCVVLGNEFNIIIGFPSDGFLLNHIFLFGVCTTLTVGIVLMNSAMVLTFWRSSQLKNRISYFLITLQSFFDTSVGLINTSFFTYYIAGELWGNAKCDVVYVSGQLAVILMGLSLTSLFLINLERYIGIVHPLAHKGNWSKTRILKYGAYHMLLWLVFFGLTFTNKTAAGYCLNVHFAGYCILTAYIYLRIYFAVAIKPYRIQSPLYSSKTEHTNQSHDSEISSQTQRIASLTKRQNRLKETKLARSCFLVVACFFMCYVPTGLVYGLKLQGFFGNAIKKWALILSLSNSLWNSLIFVWRDRSLRSEIKKAVSKFFCD